MIFRWNRWFGCALSLLPPLHAASSFGTVEVFDVIEITFAGPAQTPADAPARDIVLDVTFAPLDRDATSVTVPGFWDGNGADVLTGNVFRVRFCPTAAGRWTITRTISNHPALTGQRVGDHLDAVPTKRAGFWFPDPATGGRWYHRSDGSRPYIVGNTHYDFVSEQARNVPNGSTIERDVVGNATFFNKLRFSVVNDLYAHPEIATFLDDTGAGTNDGDHSLRPNPVWFQRVDRAVRAAHAADLIADLILNGVDSPLGRRALKAGANGGDPTPWLRYLAARYGSFPNVWFCLTNEYNTKSPTFTPTEIARLGTSLRGFLAYASPISVHGDTGNWRPDLNLTPPWHDHAITQLKNYTLDGQARHLRRNFVLAGASCPVFNDEAAYEGEGDRVSEVQAITAVLGVFAGGGYASTGYKNAKPLGQYFWGGFNPSEHTSADNLRWLRERINEIEFARLSPQPNLAPFGNAPAGAVVLAEPDWQLLLFTPSGPAGDISVSLSPGTSWIATRWDPLGMVVTALPEATGEHRFKVPASAGPLVHVFRRATPPAAAPRPFSIRGPFSEESIDSVPPADARVFVARSGLVVIEAEHANRRLANGDQFQWKDTALPGAGGALAVALPAAGTVAPVNEAASLDFIVSSAQPDPTYLWIRCQAPAVFSEKNLFIAVDGVRLRGPQGSALRVVPVGQPDAHGWVWARLAQTLPVAPAGPHTLTLLRREDGVVLDRILITTDAAFVPSGQGPPESDRAPSPIFIP